MIKRWNWKHLSLESIRMFSKQFSWTRHSDVRASSTTQCSLREKKCMKSSKIRNESYMSISTKPRKSSKMNLTFWKKLTAFLFNRLGWILELHIRTSSESSKIRRFQVQKKDFISARERMQRTRVGQVKLVEILK